MRIAQLVPKMETGGLEQGALDIACALVNAGHDSLLICETGRLSRRAQLHGVEIIEMPMASKNPYIMMRSARILRNMIAERGIDIVHARSRAPAWVAKWATKDTSAKFLSTFHGTYNFTNKLKKAYNAVMLSGDATIAISDFIATHILREYGTGWHKIHVIARGINLEHFSAPQVTPERLIRLHNDYRIQDGQKVVILPARLTRWKGQMLLVAAMQQLPDPKPRCLLVGSAQGRDDYVYELEKYIEKTDLQPHVQIVEDCRDIPALYKIASVVVSASTEPEAFGRVVAEAQAMGRLIIAPDHGGATTQIRHGENGLLFRPGDAKSLAHMLRYALNLDDVAAAALCERGMCDAHKSFDAQRMCMQTLQLYEELLRK
ncbi:MAG: glycosyltransferase family 4 protein [Pseudomonadota bacterium]